MPPTRATARSLVRLDGGGAFSSPSVSGGAGCGGSSGDAALCAGRGSWVVGCDAGSMGTRRCRSGCAVEAGLRPSGESCRAVPVRSGTSGPSDGEGRG